MLFAIADRVEVREAFNKLAKNLRRRTRPIERHIGYQGGGDTLDAHWSSTLGFWHVLTDELPAAKNRFWCAFGVDDPTESSSLSITLEINPPISGTNRRIAGAFVQDRETRDIYYAHSGKIGGGRKGIGKESFLANYRGKEAVSDVEWADGQVTPMIVIGAVDDPNLPVHLRRYIDEVIRIKEIVVASGNTAAIQRVRRFRPEFAGWKRFNLRGGAMAYKMKHPQVVDALAAQCKKLGFNFGNDTRDLYLGEPDRPTHVFEVKTDVSSTTIHTAIGQVMYYTALDSTIPHRILVLPSLPKSHTAKVLESLGIEVVKWSEPKAGIRFHDLDRVLAA